MLTLQTEWRHRLVLRVIELEFRTTVVRKTVTKVLAITTKRATTTVSDCFPLSTSKTRNLIKKCASFRSGNDRHDHRHDDDFCGKPARALRSITGSKADCNVPQLKPPTRDACGMYPTPYTLPHQIYNVSGSGTTAINQTGMITYSTTGDLVGPVPSGSAIDVDLIDPTAMFGKFISGIPNGSLRIPGQVFRAVNFTQSATESNWIVAIVGGAFYKMTQLKVIIASGEARVYAVESGYVPVGTLNVTADCFLVSAAFGRKTKITDYNVKFVQAVVFTDLPN